MFVVLYRMRLKTGQEESFQRGWTRITELAAADGGSLGSALFRESDGTWVAIARWPTREMRESYFSKGSPDPEASRLMHDATAEALPEVELSEVLNLWI